MLKYHIIICLFIVIICCHTSIQDAKNKTVIIKNILQKISRFIEGVKIEDKDLFIKDMEKRVSKITEKFGTNKKKYFDLIMEGIIIQLNNQTRDHTPKKKKVSKKELIKSSRRQNEILEYPNKSTFVLKQIMHLSPLSTKKVPQRRMHDDAIVTDPKLKRIQSIAKKLESFAKRFNNSILPVMRNQFKKNLAQTVQKMKHILGNDLGLYTDIILEGVDIAKNKQKQNDYDTAFELMNFGENNETFQTITKDINITCDDFKYYVCPKVDTIRTVKCNSDNETIAVENICDGSFQCLDESDEWNCTDYVLEKAEAALITLLEINQYASNNCLTKENSLTLLERNQLFFDIIKSKSMEINRASTLTNIDAVWDSVKKNSNNLANVISSLSKTLDSTLCSDNKINRTINEPNEVIEDETTWSPNSCDCNGPDCSGNCKLECHSICEQGYNVDKWQCASVTGNISITIDNICDGKMDCIDKSDELDCISGTDLSRFQANTLFNIIQDMLSSTAKKVPYEAVRKKLLNLNKMTKTLQQICIKENPDVAEVKRVRDKYMTEMKTIYKMNLYYAVSIQEMTRSYNFLKTVLDKLINALKRSHTGNINTILSDGCYCKYGKCAVLNCSDSCNRACAGELKLTRYYCDGQTLVNNSVPVTAVCNGTKECLGGDDESDCSQEVCRNHHLVVVRNEIATVGQKLRDTELGDALTSWVKQANSTLMAAEHNDGRPLPADIKRIVSLLLSDLVLNYSIFEEPKSSNAEFTFHQFFKASRRVMKILKSCGR